MARKISPQKLAEWLSLSMDDAKKLRRAMDTVGTEQFDRYGLSKRYEHQVDDVLDLANKLMGAHGVEGIRGNYHVDGFYFDIVALYVNTGDTYAGTLLYVTDEDKWVLTSWGDWVERNTRKYGIE
jgi:hypothetical protein